MRAQTIKLMDDIRGLEIEKSKLKSELDRFKLTLSEDKTIAKLRAQLKLHGIELEDLNRLKHVIEEAKGLNYDSKIIVEIIAKTGSLAKSIEELEKTKKSLMAEIEDLRRLRQKVLEEFPTPPIKDPNGSIIAAVPSRIVEREDGTVEVEYLKYIKPLRKTTGQ